MDGKGSIRKGFQQITHSVPACFCRKKHQNDEPETDESVGTGREVEREARLLTMYLFISFLFLNHTNGLCIQKTK